MGDRWADARYPIRAVSHLTGIGIDTLRAWERRYSAVTPSRDERGRLYSDADIRHLRLLHRAVLGGHAVGRIARLDDDELETLLDTGTAPAAAVAGPSAVALDTTRIDAALLGFDSAALEQELWHIATALPSLDLVRDLLLPALARVGDRWNQEPAGIAREHLMSATLRNLLGSFLRLYGQGAPTSRLLFATPPGERHEIGTLAAAMLAANRGLSVTYLGPDLPGEPMMAAVKASGAKVLVLGLTLPGSTQTERALKRIARELPPEVELWTGGPGTAGYGPLLGARGQVFSGLDAYAVHLSHVRSRLS